MQTATAAIVDVVQLHGQVSGSQNVIGTHRITGQYLFDRFVGDHDGDTTRMDIVRYAIANIDTDSFKKALKDAVEIAAKHGDAAKKTMQNHQTVMRLAYGAWKFAAPQLNQLGADDKTGYQAMRVLGKQALEKAGRKWDGSKAEKVDKTAAAIDEASAMRLAELKRDNPKEDGESDSQYEMRVRTMLAQEMATEDGLAAVLAAREVSVLADKVRKLCADQLEEVMSLVLTQMQAEGYEIAIG